MKTTDLIALAISSGEAQAWEMLEKGNEKQKIVARRYLDCLENMRSMNNGITFKP